MTGRLFDTYVAALQHDLVELPEGTTRLGVVRRPTRWFAGAVDENVSALGPPAELLDAVHTEREDLQMRGICEEEAHNAAWEAIGFEETYRTYLDTDSAARSAVERLVDRLDAGEDLALVCYENTAKKRCHRTILRAEVEERCGING